MSGYFMFALHGLDITSTEPQTIDRAYVLASIAQASDKALYLCYVGGYSPIPACVSKDSDNYVLHFLHYEATIAPGGIVTVRDILTPAPEPEPEPEPTTKKRRNA